MQASSAACLTQWLTSAVFVTAAGCCVWQAIVDEYLTAHSHADAQQAAELDKSEVGVQVNRVLSEFDEMRSKFDLRGTMKRPSKLEMYTKMVNRGTAHNNDNDSASTAPAASRITS